MSNLEIYGTLGRRNALILERAPTERYVYFPIWYLYL